MSILAIQDTTTVHFWSPGLRLLCLQITTRPQEDIKSKLQFLHWWSSGDNNPCLLGLLTCKIRVSTGCPADDWCPINAIWLLFFSLNHFSYRLSLPDFYWPLPLYYDFVFLLTPSRVFSEVTTQCSVFSLCYRFTLYAVDTRGRHSELSTVTLRTACPLVDDNKAEGRWPISSLSR